MDIHLPPPDAIPYGLRAMKMITTADGDFGAAERELLATVQRVFGASIDLDVLDPITPEELAAHLTSPVLRKQIVRGMTVLALIDGEAHPEEIRVIDGFAAALGVENADLTAIRHLAKMHLLRARFDILRRFWAREKSLELAKEKGPKWVASTILSVTGLREDAEMSARYRALGELPEGTFGRGYYDFIVSNEFSFPGEKLSPPETISFHDMTHVLSGYGTDPSGELQVLGFHAGCRREEKDPFSYLMFGIAQFHMGVQLSPLAEAAIDKIDPALLFRALMRGKACAIDPTDGWDPWPHMAKPLDALRAELGIPPL